VAGDVSGQPPSGAAGASALLGDRIAALTVASPDPVLVALDGRSGAGKSTLALEVGAAVGAFVIDGDDFYRGGGDTYWDARGPAEKVDLVIDWRRQNTLLECLRRGERVTWRPYDWEADDGRLAGEVTAGPAGIVILDGAYSARPELAHLFSLRVLLEVPRHVRRERFLQREGARYRAEWEARWAEAEDLYF
jgi:uridine kinase